MAGKVGCLSLQMTLDVQRDAWVAAIKRLGADRPHGFPLAFYAQKCTEEINTPLRATRRAFSWWARAVSQKVFTMPAKLLSKSASRLRGMSSIISTWLTLFSRTMGGADNELDHRRADRIGASMYDRNDYELVMCTFDEGMRPSEAAATDSASAGAGNLAAPRNRPYPLTIYHDRSRGLG